MKNALLAALVIMAVSPAWAASTSKYEQIVLDCIDYGHSQVSSEELAQCKADAKKVVLADTPTLHRYLDCIDYAHSPVTEAQSEACLKEATR